MMTSRRRERPTTLVATVALGVGLGATATALEMTRRRRRAPAGPRETAGSATMQEPTPSHPTAAVEGHRPGDG